MLEGAIGVKFPQPSHTTSPEPYPNTTIIPGTQNAASEVSFYLDAGDWLFMGIEARVVTGKPVGATPLSQHLRGVETRRQGREVQRGGDHIRDNGGA